MFRTHRASAARLSLLTVLAALALLDRPAHADEDRVLSLERDPTTRELYAPDARGPRHGSLNKLVPFYGWREQARAKGKMLQAKLYNTLHYGEHMALLGTLGYCVGAGSENELVGGLAGAGIGWVWARAHDGNKNKLARRLARAAAEQGPLLRALERKDMREVRRIANLQLDAMNALEAAVRVPEDAQDEAALVAQNIWVIHERAKTEHEDDAIAIIQQANISGPPMANVPALASHRERRQAPPPVDYRAVFDEMTTQLRTRAAELPQPHLGALRLPGFLRRGANARGSTAAVEHE
jgi:hypothetical protein